VNRAAAAALLVLAACGGHQPVERTPVEQLFSDDPLAVFGGLEEQLTEARDVIIEGRATATGAIAADVRGTLRVRRDRDSTIDVDGTHAGSALARSWRSTKPVDPDSRDVQPPTWADALLLGVTRMGVMHDWALVIGGEDPDIANGDLASWVVVEDLAWKDGDAATRTLVYRFVVGGVTNADAELTLDARGLPLRRTSVVHFPDGEMRVVETYARFDVRR
jgi:hypothetical protein